MRLVRLDSVEGRELDAFGSVGFVHARLAMLRGDAVVGVVRLGPGGAIGRHRAASPQLLAVVTGSGMVSGADGIEEEIVPGVAALWERDEEHSTRTEGGLVALVLEADELDVRGHR
jgi:quercetin dioxygenase-like cupin family protein